MKVVKVILALFALLVVGLAIATVFISPQFRVERTVEIKAPPEKIYALIAVPAEWKKWTVWNERDPNMKITYSGPPSGQGAGWGWESKSEGVGNMTFTQVEAPKRVVYLLKFPEYEMQSTGALTLDPMGPVTRVVWSNEGNVGSNPLKKLIVPFMDNMVGKDFEKGLANLKALAEKP